MEQFIFTDGNLSIDGSKRTLIIDGEENFHFSRVLRVRVGERILATNGAGKTFLCLAVSIGKEKSVCEVVEEYTDLNSVRREFCIAIAILKPMSKLETALEKCTELGARRFLLFNSERTESTRPRLDRLESIVRSAVKQSLRCRIPEIKFAGSLDEAAADGRSFEEKLVLHEKSDSLVTDRIQKINVNSPAVAFIGPEGGFSEDEIAFLIENGYSSFSLGRARLRSETAAIAIATLLGSY